MYIPTYSPLISVRVTVNKKLGANLSGIMRTIVFVPEDHLEEEAAFNKQCNAHDSAKPRQLIDRDRWIVFT